MNYSAPSFNPEENILEYDANGLYGEDGQVYANMFSRESMANDSFSTAAESFSTADDGFGHPNDSFATAVDFADVQQQYEPENGEFREKGVILIDGGDRFGVSSLTFDTREELLWAGNQGGHVTSYLSADMMKYSSFQAHATEEVRDLKTVDDGILILTPTTVSMRTRQGMRVHTELSENFKDLQCILPTAAVPNRVLIGGMQSDLIEYDLETMEIVEKYPVGEEGCVILREHPRFICHGNTNGKVVLHDPRTMREEHSFQAHSGTLSDFDAQGCYIVTCGFSNRMGQMMGDQFVMVFDVRMMKMSLPLRALVPPYYLRLMPSLSSCLACVSLMGQWLVMDAAQPESSFVSMNYHINCPPESFITAFEISSSCQSLAFGDSHGSLHLFTAGNKPVFNNFSQETELPIMEEPLHSIPFSDNTTPLSCIPLPYNDEPLLSDWPESFMKTPYWSTPAIDPQILGSMRVVGPIGYAPNTFNKKSNEFPYKNLSSRRNKSQIGEDSTSNSEEGISVHVPIRYRKIELKYNKLGSDEADLESYNRTSFPGLDMSLPNSYCNSMIQLFYYIEPLRVSVMSHLCDKEFCLACELGFLFNMLDQNTGLGLPCHASNFLRAFRTIPEASAMSLTISDQDNRARINLASKIQSWNCFVLQQIHSEMLIAKKEENRVKDMAFSFLGEPLSYVKSEYNTNALIEGEKSDSSSVCEIFGSNVVSINKCTRCSHQVEKEITSLTFNLSFHESAIELSEGSVPFVAVVQKSVCSRSVTQAWCDACAKYQPVEQFKKFKSLPSVIALNCGLDSAQDLKCWQMQHEYLLSAVQEKLKDNSRERRLAESDATNEDESASKKKDAQKPFSSPAKTPGKARPCRYGSSCVRVGCHFWHPNRDRDSNENLLNLLDQTMEYSWVPLGFKMKLNENGSVSLSDVTKEKGPGGQIIDSDDDSGIVFELVGVVSHVADPKFPDKNNLISCIRVGPSFHQRASVSPVAHWYLVNDISILPSSPEEAVWFPRWKTPCVLYWIRKTLPGSLSSCNLMNPVTADVFREDKSLAQRGRKRITFTPLTSDEMPAEGDVIAMDAEFVNLHQEEAEIRSDGTRTTIKPSQKSVARITCIRGQGPLIGTPFLDDYISTQEQVVDYLTQFSGIKPGDLDANYSQKHLTTLKSTYVKLRYLVDRGVKIVGHGLKNDLRVINIIVPQSQLIDTVHLFHLPRNRMVSLKFLAWYFLKLKIQSVTHDSIEDAKTALALYHEYLRIVQEEGTIQMKLQEMYEIGKKLQWKVPGDELDE